MFFWNPSTNQKRVDVPSAYMLPRGDAVAAVPFPAILLTPAQSALKSRADHGAFICRVFSFGEMADGFDQMEADFINAHRPGVITKSDCRRLGLDPPPLSQTLLMMSDRNNKSR